VINLQQLPEVYYDHKEAREKLGMTRDAFNHYVKQGLITPTRIIGKYRYFAKREIDMLAMSIQAALLAGQASHIEFVKATPETQKDEFDLAVLNFGEKTKTFHPYRVELLKRNPDMSYYLYDGRHLAASINIVPISPEGIAKFKDGERGWLLGEYVQPFTPDQEHELIVIDCMTTTLAPESRRKIYALRLLFGLSNVLLEWAKQGINVTNIYANGGTPDGRHILETAKFEFLGLRENGRRIYQLNIAASGLNILEPYKEVLAEYKSKHGGM
jgi:hypothetical protein